MITLELYKRNWNTHYLQYNPEKWSIMFEPLGHGIDVRGMTLEVSLKRSYGVFDGVSIRTNSIPECVSDSDIEVWD
jgi:hypothetical protein